MFFCIYCELDSNACQSLGLLIAWNSPLCLLWLSTRMFYFLLQTHFPIFLIKFLLLVHVEIQFLLHLKEHWRSYSLDVTVISTFPITEFIFLFVCKLCWSYKAQFIQFLAYTSLLLSLAPFYISSHWAAYKIEILWVPLPFVRFL